MLYLQLTHGKISLMYTKPFSWQVAWYYPSFRIKLIIGSILLIGIFFYIPSFFNHIEQRQGILLNDSVLTKLPAVDVSFFIFLTLYATVALCLFRMSNNAKICLTSIWTFAFLCLFRMVTITLVPLNPPTGIIALADPCSVMFYRSHIITKDLFFSGHTATLFIAGLCMDKKGDKIIAFSAAGIIGLLLLIQHVHYTADVLAAPLFSWICWYLGKSVGKL
jgi:hypothetical protein